MAAAEPKPISPALCASLVVLERGALLFGAVGAARSDVRSAVLGSLVTGGLFLARSSAFSARVRRLEIATYDELLDAAHGTVDPGLTPSALRAALARGVESIASLRGRIVPGMIGEAIAAVAMAPYVVATLPHRALLALLLGALAAAAVALVFRRAARALSRGTFELYEAAFRSVLEGLMGREDIVAAGTAASYKSRVRERTNAWAKMQLRAATGTALLGRAPALVAIAVGVAVFVLLDRDGRPLDMAPAGALLPSFGGILLGAAEWVQIEPRTKELRRVLDAAREPPGKPAAKALFPLSVDDLRVEFGDRVALDGVTLSVDGPKLVVLAGPNGSGKSTLLRALLGIVPPSQGTIALSGVALADVDLNSLRRRVSYLSQRPHFPAMVSVFEAMSFLDSPNEADALGSLERVEVIDALRTHSPTDPLSVPIDSLSGGERQRVALARALLRDAEIYLFDEPDANLDRRGIERVVTILRELSKTSLVIVAGHTEEVIAAADVVVQLDHGKVIKAP